MARTFIRQEVQIAESVNYTDNLTIDATLETGAASIEGDLNSLRSMVHHIVALQGANWYDAITTPATFTGEGEAQRGVNLLNTELHELERKRFLERIEKTVDIFVGANADETLTATVNFTNGETVTMGTKTYTFQTVLTDVDGNVLIGASAADSLDNLAAGVNLGAGSGSTYAASMTINADVQAHTDTGNTLIATALLGGTAGNSIATTETAANASWGAATLSGGTDTGNHVVLTRDQIPTLTTAAAVGSVNTLGVVVAQNASFDTHSLDEVPCVCAVTPRNMTMIVDGTTRDPILSSGRTVYGLLQSESGTDPHTFGFDPTAGTRLQISFVRINATGDDLEAVPAADIQAETINYTYNRRVGLEDLLETALINQSTVDLPAAVSVTRQGSYDGQGATPVDVTTNSILDLEGAGLSWEVRDDLEATLFKVIEGSAGGTSEVQVASDVDVFNVDSVLNDMANALRVRTTGSRPIYIGDSDGVLETSAGDFEVRAAAELYLDDGNQTTSTWAQTAGIKLSETTAEWDAFEVAFGEVSILNAITQSFDNVKRTKVQAVLTADVAADNDVNGPGTAHSNTDVDLAPYDQVGAFVDDVEVYLNGELLRNGANAAANEDVYPGGTPADGDLAFEFGLKGTGSKPDQLTVIVNGQ